MFSAKNFFLTNKSFFPLVADYLVIAGGGGGGSQAGGGGGAGGYGSLTSQSLVVSTE